MIGNESGVDLLDQQWMMDDGLPSGDWAQTDLTPPLYQDFDYYNKLITDKMQYAIDAIKSAPRTMITETATPWSHPQLYRDHMPTSIRGKPCILCLSSLFRSLLLTMKPPDAHAACALYMAKTNINGPIIMRSVETYAQSLLAAPSPSTPPERLAHTHALLLYQIIRLLDGDILSRTSAERDIPALEASAYALLAHVNFETPLLPPPALDLPIHPLPPTTRFWERWAFEESTRRTLLFSSFFLQTYRAVSGRQLLPCDGKLFIEHTLTMSAHLWEARTAAEFAASWRDREHFVVANAQFDSFIRDAKADDVDQFGRILISALMGIEEADAWLSVRGGSLR